MTRSPMPTDRRPSARSLVVVAATAMMVVSGCANAEPGAVPTATAPTEASPRASTSDPGVTESPSARPVPEETDMPTDVPTDGDLQDVVAAARQDLGDRIGAGGEFEVVVARRETFPNGALGCPREGEMYTQALVDGYRVVLGRDDRVWLYTAGRDGVPQLCPSEAEDGGHDFVPPPGIDE